jgi:uncharacterized membrane protein YfcA
MGFAIALVTIAAIAVAAFAGAVASVAGFGIGSILTPLFALASGMKIAVAAVSIPHMAGTALRLWMLRGHVDRRLLYSFGVASAVFGLVGALLHAYAAGSILTLIFGLLLILAGISSLTGIFEMYTPGKATAWLAGGLSGIFGGLVGNQGGIRTAALLGFNVPRDAFVATATAIALMVDAGRVPVYLATQWRALSEWRTLILIATAGVLIGTVTGAKLLRRIPPKVFQRTVACLVIILGAYMLLTLWRGE